MQNRQEGGFISSYHDRYDLEADAVLDLDDGRYALIEFKLGSREIEEAKYKSKEITPEQEALLSRPNSDQYPAERELNASNGSTVFTTTYGRILPTPNILNGLAILTAKAKCCFLSRAENGKVASTCHADSSNAGAFWKTWHRNNTRRPRAI